jgi:hypothetical protein
MIKNYDQKFKSSINSQHSNADTVAFHVGIIGREIATGLGYLVMFDRLPYVVLVPVDDAETFDTLHAEAVFRETGKHLGKPHVWINGNV